MSRPLPPLRALQAFEAVGRLGAVGAAARELGVTPGAVSQKIRQLEDHVGAPLVVKDGRGLALSATGRAYHALIGEGFRAFRRAQHFADRLRDAHDIAVSGLPSLMIRWLNPLLSGYRAADGQSTFRLECTHREPDPRLIDVTFRLTYGDLAERFPFSRPLFRDSCFPVCAPAFRDAHPEATDPEGLRALPLVRIGWAPTHSDPPGWESWFAFVGARAPDRPPVASFQLSSLALETVAAGEGVALGQASFVARDLAEGRLVRLSEAALPLPQPYMVCWGEAALEAPPARQFLDWLIAEARPLDQERSGSGALQIGPQALRE
jgi:LysR family glycine cleavage system transcriptional activator